MKFHALCSVVMRPAIISRPRFRNSAMDLRSSALAGDQAGSALAGARDLAAGGEWDLDGDVWPFLNCLVAGTAETTKIPTIGSKKIPEPLAPIGEAVNI